MKAMLSWPIAVGFGIIVLLFVTTAQAQTVIDTVQELESIQDNLFGNYVLGANINASGVTNFAPIGSTTDPFYGTLNGNGYAISNLNISSSASYAGLFADNGGTIENLGVTNEVISNTATTPTIGGIAGVNTGIITQSYTLGGALSANNGSPATAAGGLVGDNAGTISLSHAGNSVQVSAGRVGGLAGVNAGTVSQSYATGPVSAGDSSTVGGLIGASGSFGPIGPYSYPNSVSQSYATGNVTAGSQSNVGGLIGVNGSIVGGSYATGNVSGGSSSEVGGLIGVLNQQGSLSRSFATGSVAGSASRDVGGLVGWNEDTPISQSYALGAVYGNGSSHVGGLVGENGGGCWPCSASIDQSYSAGAVSNVGGGQTGGLVGLSYASGQTYDPGVVTNSYWDATASGQPTSSGGAPLTTSKLQSGKLPTGFDQTAWTASAGSYPTLISNPRPYYLYVTVSTFGQSTSGQPDDIEATATVANAPPSPNSYAVMEAPANVTSLEQLASYYHYAGFDWEQEFTHDDTGAMKDTSGNVLSTPYYDPPSGGYASCLTSSKCPAGTETAYPFYYDPTNLDFGDITSTGCAEYDSVTCVLNMYGSDEVNFFDSPDRSNPFSPGDYLGITTSLVGYIACDPADACPSTNGFEPTATLYSWAWVDDYVYQGPGGISFLSNATDVAAPPGGTGGIALIPEASTWLMMLLGFTGIGGLSYRASRCKPYGTGRLQGGLFLVAHTTDSRTP